MKSVHVNPALPGLHLLWRGSDINSINYWQVNSKDLTPAIKYEFKGIDFAATSLVTGKVLSTEDDSGTLFIQLMGKHEADSDEYYDQWFTESYNNGKNWSVPIQVPRDNLKDKCDRYGDALLVIPDTGRIFIFYNLECESGKAKIAYVTRSPGNKDFSREVVISGPTESSQYRMSLAATYSIRDKRIIVHLFWADHGPNSRSVMYSSTLDHGETWSKPRAVSGIGELYSGFLALTVAANKGGPYILGTYATMQPQSLRMFYSDNHGESFQLAKSDLSGQTTLSWEYRINSMCTSALRLFMLAQVYENRTEAKFWDLRTMSPANLGVPFENTLSGALIACQEAGSGRTLLTAIGSVTYSSMDTPLSDKGKDTRIVVRQFLYSASAVVKLTVSGASQICSYEV